MSQSAMTDKINACQDIIGYQFQDHLICWEALQVAGSGVYKAGGREIPNGNKRLAVVGVLALDLVLCQDWYSSGANEGRNEEPLLCLWADVYSHLDEYSLADFVQCKSLRCGHGPRARSLHQRQSNESSRYLPKDHGYHRPGDRWSCFP